MNILVTGGAGFIGSHLVDELINEGHDVTVVDNLSSGNKKHINNKAKFYKLDIQGPDVDKIFHDNRPEYIFHQAAQIDVRRSVADPVYDAKVNILGSINIMQCCIRHNVRKIIFASSGGAIYGEQIIFPAPEDHPLKPISPYGISKLVVEHYLNYYRMIHSLDFTVLRYANVFGPRQDPFGEAGVVAIFMQKMLNGERPTINGDGEQTRDFVYVGDVARANILAMQNRSNDIFNIGTGIETSINALYENIKMITNFKLDKKYAEPKQGEQRRSVVDNAKARQILRWSPEKSLIEGLMGTYEYFKKTA